MSRYFPLFVDLEQKKIVVVGAGRIAERRIQTLLSFEAQITVIAPEASVKIRKLAKEGRLHWQQERWSPEAESFLDGSLFVLAAVDDGAVNKAVFRACRARGIPVNCSDDRTRCDFYFPGIVQNGNVVIGVTASGSDHKEARKTVEKIRSIFPEEELK